MKCTIKNCNNRLTQAQVKYSYRVYNTGLCWDHQRVRDFKVKLNEELGICEISGQKRKLVHLSDRYWSKQLNQEPTRADWKALDQDIARKQIHE